MKRKKMLIIVAGTLLAVSAVASGATYTYFKNRVTPDMVFRSYIKKYAVIDAYEPREDFSGTGTTLTGTGILKAKDKQFRMRANVTCSATIRRSPVEIQATMQYEGATPYMRLDKISGTVTVEDYNVDLAKVLDKVKGTWYRVEEDVAVQAQIHSSIYVFQSMIVAPSIDTDALADAMIQKKAFTYTFDKMDGETYVFRLKADKTAYLEVLKELAPELKVPDLVLDNAFAATNTMDTIISIKKDGTLVSERGSVPNPCSEIITAYTGEVAEGTPADVSGTSTPMQSGSTKIERVSSTKELEKMAEDFILE